MAEGGHPLENREGGGCRGGTATREPGTTSGQAQGGGQTGVRVHDKAAQPAQLPHYPCVVVFHLIGQGVFEGTP